jgi:uncharacterized protein YuzE
MKFNYYKETDSLYVEFSDKPSAYTEEAQNGILIDYDKDHKIVGLDIDQASNLINMRELIFHGLPDDLKLEV